MACGPMGWRIEDFYKVTIWEFLSAADGFERFHSPKANQTSDEDLKELMKEHS